MASNVRYIMERLYGSTEVSSDHEEEATQLLNLMVEDHAAQYDETRDNFLYQLDQQVPDDNEDEARSEHSATTDGFNIEALDDLNLVGLFEPDAAPPPYADAVAEHGGTEVPAPENNDDIDLPFVPEVVSDAQERVRSHRRRQFVMTVIQEAKNKFPLYKRSEANRLVVRKYIHDRFVDRGMRPSHVGQWLELAVELAFQRTANDDHVDLLMRTRAIEENVDKSTWRWYWFIPKLVTRKGFSSN